MKRWRVYFNKKEDYPCLWSVDEGSAASEIRVQWVSLRAIAGWTHHSLSRRTLRDAAKEEPCAWIEFEGFARFQEGGVVFTPVEEK